jgi:hypothetical protein
MTVRQLLENIDSSELTEWLPATNYAMDLACEPARITPKFGQIWPINLPQIGSVWVTFDAGYGDATQVAVIRKDAQSRAPVAIECRPFRTTS